MSLKIFDWSSSSRSSAASFCSADCRAASSSSLVVARTIGEASSANVGPDTLSALAALTLVWVSWPMWRHPSTDHDQSHKEKEHRKAHRQRLRRPGRNHAGPAGPEEYDNPFPPERGGWLMPFSDQLGRRSRHRLVRPSRRDPAWPHHLSDHAAALEPDHRLGRR